MLRFKGVAALLRRGALLALTAGLATPAAAALSVTPSWNGWHWARTGPLSIQVGDNVSSAWDTHLRSAASAWSAASPVIDFRVVAGTAPSGCGFVVGTVQVCNDNYGATGWLGFTNVWVSSGHIVTATIRLNDYYFNMARYNTTAWRLSTACHELGHSLGLDHNNSIRTDQNTGGCMDTTNDPAGALTINAGRPAMQPGSADKAGLSRLYNHLDTTQLTQTRPTLLGFAGLPVEGYEAVEGVIGLPEPSSWAMLVTGFGFVGAAVRRRRPQAVAA